MCGAKNLRCGIEGGAQQRQQQQHQHPQQQPRCPLSCVPIVRSRGAAPAQHPPGHASDREALTDEMRGAKREPIAESKKENEGKKKKKK